ncbi:MerR family transcriptional regulator [Phenylobacterium sp.]|uniref:MerR family transcriptional regulator n=1 Tax=Phenylobacterium sp. TaxID=1871053 RepID=UPI0025FC92A0|nr:MerR family transcriptional regulator [Phenylobacterium sp.]MCA6286594.1 MerR family transcriptional regulator [Phenylobacterium sp.]MCA6309794.1 MerR family transcriptional regulator [Phenylobacterium sp.]MCA6322723.1 MerR family transcriptional regulator [Phenylobacterium sp.]MCA6336096.1 MerR family transcriptional regulator [Phenylobacterium sp.]MCA6338841.1 MerR family transcriptional regulator [Phenylobacterium sp.]
MAKGPEAFRTISEAAEEVGVAPHVLRFWETRFSVIRPMKRAGGRRFYRPQDVALLRTLRILLHDQGRSIRDVQRLSRSEGARALAALAAAATPEQGAAGSAPAGRVQLPAPEIEGRRRLTATRDELLAIKLRLDALLSR